MTYRSFLPGINGINERVFAACENLDVSFIQHSFFASRGELNKALFAPNDWASKRPIHLSRCSANEEHKSRLENLKS